jgi:hypothetical protein
VPVVDDPFAHAGALEGVPSAMVAARDGIDALLRDRGLRRSSVQVTASSLLRGAAASAALAGSRYDVATLADGGGDDVARGVVRLSTQLLGLVPVWAASPPQALARVHAVAAAGVTPAADLGRPVGDTGTAARLADLSARLTVPTAAPALVVAAITHAEVLTAAPFRSLNGVIARAAERLVLVSRGVDPASVTVPEAAHARLEAAYRVALGRYGAGGADGVRDWLLYAAQAYGVAVEESPLLG